MNNNSNRSDSRKKKSKSRRKARPNVPRSSNRATPLLSRCARDYALVMTNPFTNVNPPCVPDLHAVPSFKCKMWARGTFRSSTVPLHEVSNRGVILFQPGNIDSQNLDFPIKKTIATSTGAVLNQSLNQADVGTWEFADLMGATYSGFGQAPSQKRYRTVAAGIRVRNVTPSLYRGGSLYAVPNGTYSSFVGTTFEDVLSNPSTRRLDALSDKWQYCIWKPALDVDYQYGNNVAYTRADLAVVCEAPLLGETAYTQIYEYEVCSYYEMVGADMNMVTRSESDVAGMSAIRNVIGDWSFTSSGLPDFQGLMKNIQSALITASGAYSIYTGGGGARIASAASQYLTN